MSRWIVRARPRVLASGLLSSALLVSGLLATAGPASAVVPSSPTAVVASWSGPNLAVSWQHPGGAGISYRADVFDIAVGGAAVASASTASKSTTVTGLTKGTRYWVSVVAIEDATADTSPPSTRTAVPGVPDAPTIDSVRAGNASARVTWSAPASDGGSSITRYIARAYDANPGGTEVGSCEPASLTTLTCVIPGLANGADAWISVTAENAVGVGPASARVKVTPGALPSAPQSVTVTDSTVPCASPGRRRTRTAATRSPATRPMPTPPRSEGPPPPRARRCRPPARRATSQRW